MGKTGQCQECPQDLELCGMCQLGGRLYSTNQTQMYLSYPSVTPIYSKATENVRIKLLKLAQVFVNHGLFYKQTKNLRVGGRING